MKQKRSIGNFGWVGVRTLLGLSGKSKQMRGVNHVKELIMLWDIEIYFKVIIFNPMLWWLKNQSTNNKDLKPILEPQ